MARISDQIAGLPDGVDFASHELTKPLQNIFLLGIGGEANPRRYAEIFAAAAESSDASMWMQYACRFEEINGLRRVKDADIMSIARLWEELMEEVVSGLPSTRSKGKLLGRAFWNRALILRGIRDYRSAARNQRLSSAWYGTAEDVSNQLVSLFAAEVEEVTAAFVDGAGEDALKNRIKALIAARDVMVGLPRYPEWMEQNASLHIAWAVMMAMVAFNDYTLDSEFDVGVDFPAFYETQFPHWKKLFQVWGQFLQGNSKLVLELKPVFVESSSVQNTTLSVQLLHALSRRDLRINGWEADIRVIAEDDGPDGGIPRAVAKKLLQRFSAELD